MSDLAEEIRCAEAGDRKAGARLLEKAAKALELDDTLQPELAHYLSRRLWAVLGLRPLSERSAERNERGTVTLAEIEQAERPRPLKTASDLRRALRIGGKRPDPEIVRSIRDAQVWLWYAEAREAGETYEKAIESVAKHAAISESVVKAAVERLARASRKASFLSINVETGGPGPLAKHAPRQRKRSAPSKPSN